MLFKDKWLMHALCNAAASCFRSMEIQVIEKLLTLKKMNSRHQFMPIYYVRSNYMLRS